MKHRLLPVLAFAALSLFLTGCPKAKDKVADKGEGPPKGKGARFAFVTNNTNEFWTGAQRGFEDGGKSLGVQAEFRMPSTNATEEQQRIVQDLITKGVNGIGVSVNNPKHSVRFFKNDVASQVPFITVDNDLPDPKARRCYIGTNNYPAGRAAGEMVLKHVPEGGKIAIFVGQMEAENAVERRQGVLDVLLGIDRKEIGELTPLVANQKVGKYTLIDTFTDGGKQDECQQKAQDALTKHPDIVCMVGLWAYNPPAMLRASKQSKLDKSPVIVGFDHDLQTLEAIQKDEIVGTVVQNPYQFGFQAIRILKALSDGDDGFLKKEYPQIDEKSRVYIPHRVIAKNNVDEFLAELKKQSGK